MAQQNRIFRWLSTIEWQWSLWTFIKGSSVVGSFALPAWAVGASEKFAEYAPFSWVAAGFLGMLIVSIAYALSGWAYSKFIRARYDAKMIAGGSYVDPMAKTYEDRRIFLGEFCLPSHPMIEKKTFINCQIIGPANIVLEFGNSVQDAAFPISDAVLMKPGHKLFNAVIVRDCIFRQCSFQRVTFLVPSSEYETAKNWHLFNWITRDAPPQIEPTTEDDLDLLPSNIEEEKQP